MNALPRVIVCFVIALSLHEVALATEYVGSGKCSECLQFITGCAIVGQA